MMQVSWNIKSTVQVTPTLFAHTFTLHNLLSTTAKKYSVSQRTVAVQSVVQTLKNIARNVIASGQSVCGTSNDTTSKRQQNGR